MTSAISVELDGTTFAVDERAYAALRSYLDRAGARLGAHPDRDEVIAGLEESIAARLRQRTRADAAIDEAAMLAALEEVGRVDGPALDDSAPSRSRAREPRTRRLYRLREGQTWAGVCTGVAAFAAIDVNIIRLIFIAGTVFSGGALAILYVLLVFLMPLALTEEEIAEAHGGSPPA